MNYITTYLWQCILLVIFGNVTTVQEKPQIKELHKKIVPLWAAKWKELGEELGLSHNELETISLNHAYHPRRCEECCKAVLRKWLDQDLTASWNKIDEATNNISGTTLYTGKGIIAISYTV